MEFSGRIDSVPLADVLQWAAREERTGALVLRRSRKEKRVYFSQGRIVSCYSDDPSDYFGRYLRLHDLLSERDLVRALSHGRDNEMRLGSALRELGLLDEAGIAEVLAGYIGDLVCDLFLWKRGVFFFEYEVLTGGDLLLPEPLDPTGLSMEGARWEDNMRRMERVFVHDNVVLRAGEAWTDDLPPVQRALALSLRDREQSLADLHEQLGGTRYRIYEAAFEMAVASILDVASVGEERSSHGSMEVRVADLLIEEAAEEQVLLSRRMLTLPADIFQKLCPIWTEGPPEEESKRMPNWARAFSDRVDGETTFGELLSEDGQERQRQVSFVTLHLRKGRLALLPRALSSFETSTDEEPSAPWWKRVFRLDS